MISSLYALAYLCGFVLAIIAFRAEALRGEDSLDCLDWLVITVCAVLWPLFGAVVFAVLASEVLKRD